MKVKLTLTSTANYDQMYILNCNNFENKLKFVHLCIHVIRKSLAMLDKKRILLIGSKSVKLIY